MIELSFEHDSAELLEACALALRALPGSGAQSAASDPATMTAAPGWSDAATQGVGWGAFADVAYPHQSMVCAALTAQVEGAADAEEFSRAIERDARRYDRS